MSEVKERIDNLITNRIKQIAEKIVEKQYALNPGFWRKFGDEGWKISVRDASYHLPYLAESIIIADPSTITSYVSWVKTLFRGLNFPDDVMVTTLHCTREVLKEELPNDLFLLAEVYIQKGIEAMSNEMPFETSYIDQKDYFGNIANEYTNLLLKGLRADATRIIMDEVRNGTDIKRIYLDVFQKSQYEIGYLWLTNKISIAQEHYCSAATQVIISQLYPHIFSSLRKGYRFIAACIGGELHEIGVRMVSDFFEMEGWDTFYLGANTPASSIIRAIKDYKPHVLGLSVSMPYHKSALKETIDIIRRTEEGKNIKIMIGGRALNTNASLEYYRADAFAPGAKDAVEVASCLLN